MAVRADQRQTAERAQAERVAQANAQGERTIREPLGEWEEEEDDEYANPGIGYGLGEAIGQAAERRYLHEERTQGGSIRVAVTLALVYVCAIAGVTHAIATSPLFHMVKERSNVTQTADYRMDVPHAECVHTPPADLHAYLRCRNGSR